VITAEKAHETNDNKGVVGILQPQQSSAYSENLITYRVRNNLLKWPAHFCMEALQTSKPAFLKAKNVYNCVKMIEIIVIDVKLKKHLILCVPPLS
jgi:hypothetical protein